MGFQSRLDRHEQLMNRMAARNGADLDLALQTGTLSPEDYREAVFACAGCSAPDACSSRLDTATPGIPEMCRNTEMLNRMTDRLSGMVTPED